MELPYRFIEVKAQKVSSTKADARFYLTGRAELAKRRSRVESIGCAMKVWLFQYPLDPSCISTRTQDQIVRIVLSEDQARLGSSPATAFSSECRENLARLTRRNRASRQLTTAHISSHEFGMIPFVIDNQQHRLASILNDLLAQCPGGPFDVATAYFSVSGFRLLRERVCRVGAFRLLIGAEPKAGADLGLRPERRGEFLRTLQGDLAAEPFSEATFRLVEELVAFLRADKVQVRLFDQGFLHAKAYLFHRDAVGPNNRADRLRPFAAIVGSSNFTGPGLTSNRELNLVHRVLTADDDAVDREAARAIGVSAGSMHRGCGDRLRSQPRRTARRCAANDQERSRRARAVSRFDGWFERQWGDSVDFKDALIELLDASKFGAKEYTPYQIYIKALYEYFETNWAPILPGRPQRGRAGRVPGGCGQKGPPHSRPLRRRADRRFSRPGKDLDRQKAAGGFRLPPPAEGRGGLPGVAKGDVDEGACRRPRSPRTWWAWRNWAGKGSTPRRYGDADCILIDESHNFRNGKSNRYIALDEAIQRNGGRGRDGERKKIILLSATPINNDLV